MKTSHSCVNILSQKEEKVTLDIGIISPNGSSKFYDTLMQKVENRHLAMLSVSHLMKSENGIKLPFWDNQRDNVIIFQRS